ncbi:MAG: dTDP-4-amino-4,6-dideoxygalactose transaminase [Synergistota bacterium]|nr:dTDP-4-amino-4,6-dideoxygalactose transaminase [Synergistota bacterium]
MKIPFNKPYVTGREIEYIQDVIESDRFAGNGEFSKRCAKWLEDTTGCRKAVLVPSGTAALEMMMILAGIGPGDEVIMPSFTFSSTANAIVLRGATPVFIDIRPDTLNMDEKLIERSINPHTKAILPVHYAGVGCEMDAITAIAEKHDLLVLEDAAQGIMSYYKGKHLGSIGQMGILSFHETKNIHCGEGGALLINDPALVERAEIVMEKGTDRSRFFRGEIDKYSWVDVGSSYLINEITAAFLWAQLEEAENIVEKRLSAWNAYYSSLEQLEINGFLRRPLIPKEVRHNAHIFQILFINGEERDKVMALLNSNSVNAVFHYIPLDSATAGVRFGRTDNIIDDLPITSNVSSRLLRLPLWPKVPVEKVALQIRIAFKDRGI